jgi:Xaa-Pro dipeptidase
MEEEGIALAIFEDHECSRDQSVRYLSGQPGDALLLLSSSRKALLIPWDINMAALYAAVDDIIPYNKFDLDPYLAACGAAAYFKVPYGGKIEIPPATPYPAFLKYVNQLSDYDVLCRTDGVKTIVDAARAVKDQHEIDIYRSCSEKTNEIIGLLEQNVADNTLKTETDVALFIEAECRKRSCDGTGFTTLAAGPSRSFGIHCFPSFTGAPFAAKGLSILDFGIVFQGYTSDVTLTFVRAPSKTQEKMLSLIEAAFNRAFSIVAEAFAPENPSPALPARDLALAVDVLFKKHSVFMPHGLGHGIGLEAHEAPYLRRTQTNTYVLERGNIFTIEPGLYDSRHGGCRLENDIFLGEQGAEILTRSKIVRL